MSQQALPIEHSDSNFILNTTFLGPYEGGTDHLSVMETCKQKAYLGYAPTLDFLSQDDAP